MPELNLDVDDCEEYVVVETKTETTTRVYKRQKRRTPGQRCWKKKNKKRGRRKRKSKANPTAFEMLQKPSDFVQYQILGKSKFPPCNTLFNHLWLKRAEILALFNSKNKSIHFLACTKMNSCSFELLQHARNYIHTLLA